MTDEEFNAAMTAWYKYMRAVQDMLAQKTVRSRDRVQGYGMAFHHNHWVYHVAAISDLIRERFPNEVERVFRFDPKVKDDPGEIMKRPAFMLLAREYTDDERDAEAVRQYEEFEARCDALLDG